MKNILSIFLVFIAISAFTQEQAKVNWVDFETAVKLSKEDGKPLFIDMYTDWCGWCKKLDKNTFSQSQISAYLNENFHPVKFDAESTDTVMWKDSAYTNIYKGKLDENGNPYRAKSHSLAQILMNGRMAYPTVVFYVPEKDMIAPIPGYKTPEQLQDFLLYFGEKIYNLNLFEAYTKGMNTQKIVH